MPVLLLVAFALSESQFIAAVLVSAAVMVTMGWVSLQPPVKDEDEGQ